MDRTLQGATSPEETGPGSNGNQGELHIPQISKAGASPSDGLIPYPEHSMGSGVSLLCRDAVGVFYSPSWLGLSFVEVERWN